MRKANVIFYTCTFCKVKEGADVPASVVTTFDAEITDTVNWNVAVRTFPAASFVPGASLGIAFGACTNHEDAIVRGQIAGFIGGLEGVADAVLLEEQSDMEVDDTPESYTLPGEDDDEDQEEGEDIVDTMARELGAEAVQEHVKEVGEKVVPSNVSNPTPEQADKDAEITHVDVVAEPWRAHFPEDYEPSLTAPKDDEKKACFVWFNRLPKREKDALSPKGWPERRMPNALIIEWHKSEEFAKFAGFLKSADA